MNHGQPRSGSQSRLLSSVIALCLLLSSAMPLFSGVALAQSADTEAPVIGFDELREGRRGDTQVFSANVTDDNEVTEVILYYRDKPDTPYTRVPMQAISGTPIYTVSVSGIDATSDRLEYYIEARDQDRNRTLRGFAFDPLVRDLVDDAPSGAAVAAAPAESDAGATGMSTGRKVLYGVLGLLAVGALAAAASSDSDSSNDSSGDDTTVPLTIEVGRPAL